MKPNRKKEPFGKTEQLMKIIRQSPMFRQHIPQEAGIGWPIPLLKESKLFVILPCFGFSSTAKPGQTNLYPIIATITVDWYNQQPVEYANLHESNPAPELNWKEQVGIFPHETVSQMRIREYKEKRRELLAMYDEMFETLTKGESLSSEWANNFSSLLRTLMEPALEPYYRALDKDFFERFLAS